MDKEQKIKAHKYFMGKYGETYTNQGNLMSFGYDNLPRLIRCSSKLSSDAKICYGTIMDMILNNEETIPWLYYPSQKRIALLSGLSRQYVNKAIHELVQAGLLGVKRQGLGQQNVYCLLSPSPEFVDEAINYRAILNLIKHDEMSWNNISDSLKVIAESDDKLSVLLDKLANEKSIVEKEKCHKSMLTLDVSNNVHQEVNGKYATQSNDGLTESDNSGIHQEVISENGTHAMPPLSAPAISEIQELSSVGLSSDESSSPVINNPGVDDEKTDDDENKTKMSNNPDSKFLPKMDSKTLNEFTGYMANIRKGLLEYDVIEEPSIRNQRVVEVPLLRKWFDAGIPITCVLSGIKTTISHYKKKDKIRSVKFFENEVQKAYAEYNKAKATDKEIKDSTSNSLSRMKELLYGK